MRFLYTRSHRIIHSSQKVEITPTYSSIDEQITKMWYIHTMEYFSALRKGILTHAAVWMNLKDIMVNEINQSKKKIVQLHLHEVSEAVKFIETESKKVARTWGKEEMGSCLTGIVSILQDGKKLWRLAAQQYEMLNTTELYT